MFDLRDKNNESPFYTQSLLNQMISHLLLVMMLSCSFPSCNHLSTVFPGYARLGDSACGVCWAGGRKTASSPMRFHFSHSRGASRVMPGTTIQHTPALEARPLSGAHSSKNEHFRRMRPRVLMLPGL